MKKQGFLCFMLTVQGLGSWFCVDLTRVGDEALIESIHVLTLVPPFPLPSSKVFNKSFFWGRPKTPPSKAIIPGTAALGRALEFEIDIANSRSVLFTLRFVILYQQQ